jgi:sec-independent protein translocase protein TatB
MFGLGEILLILVVALIVLGPNKLPEVAKTLGRAYGEFRKASQGLRELLNEQAEKSGFTGAFSDIKNTVAEAMKEPQAKSSVSEPAGPDAAAAAGAGKETAGPETDGVRVGDEQAGPRAAEARAAADAPQAPTDQAAS